MSRAVSTKSMLLAVYGALLVLLVATAASTRVHLGAWALPVALAIATAKLALIFMFFMQLRVHRGLVRVFAGAGFFWLGILLVLALSDYASRG